jgi:hypothetical protein
MHMLMWKNNRGMSVVIPWGLLVEDFKILSNLIFINFEEEVRLSLDITVHILRESLPFFTFKLLLKSKSI